jgi:hypothetical protein
VGFATSVVQRFQQLGFDRTCALGCSQAVDQKKRVSIRSPSVVTLANCN